MLHMVGFGHGSLTKRVRDRGLSASIRTLVYPTIVHYLKASFGMAQYPPNTLCTLAYHVTCIKKLIDNFDISASVNQGHRVEVQFLGGQHSIRQMVQVCRQYLDNAHPLPVWARCCFRIALDLYRMVLMETYQSLDSHFSMRHESTPPSLNHKKAFSIMLNTISFNHYSLQPFVLRLAVHQLPTLSKQIVNKGSSSGFSFPVSLRDRNPLEAASTPTTSVQVTQLHLEIQGRVSIRPHPRNGRYCATTSRGGCTASFRTIEELIDHLANKYGTDYHIHLKCPH